jgi:puromycin-sensitive aminopeptidase
LGDNKSNKKIFLSNKNLIVPLPKDWVKVNMSETGFYRTAYDKELLKKLVIPVQDKILSSSDRLGLIRDLFALSEAGTIPTTDTLEFLKAYKNEDDYNVWLEIAMGLALLDQLLPKEPLLKKLTLDLFSPVADKLGWEKKKGEIHTDSLLRSLVISRSGRSGNEKIISEAKERFALIQKGENISPDIRSSIYSIISTWGGKKEFLALIKKYKEETLHEEKNRIGNVLGNFSDPAILEKVCEFSMSKDVREQDTIFILSGVGSNPLGRDIWWNFVQKNWKTLVSRYGEGGLSLSRAIVALRGSAEERHLRSFKKFFATHEAPGAKRAIEQVMERMEGNIAWLKRDGKSIQKFLRNN